MSEERKFKASHFENIQELIASCIIWIKTDDYDAYCRFFDMGAMEELIKEIEKQQKEIEHWKVGMEIVERDKNNHIERLEKELEQEKEKNKEYEKQLDLDYVDKNYISKDKLKFVLSKLNISDVEPWSTYKIDGKILFDLQELL